MKSEMKVAAALKVAQIESEWIPVFEADCPSPPPPPPPPPAPWICIYTFLDEAPMYPIAVTAGIS